RGAARATSVMMHGIDQDSSRLWRIEGLLNDSFMPGVLSDPASSLRLARSLPTRASAFFARDVLNSHTSHNANGGRHSRSTRLDRDIEPLQTVWPESVMVAERPESPIPALTLP